MQAKADFPEGSKTQKGIITYGLAANRQKPFAGAFHDAIFNTWRRFLSQVFYIAPPMIAGYYIMDWAVQRSAPSPGVSPLQNTDHCAGTTT